MRSQRFCLPVAVYGLRVDHVADGLGDITADDAMTTVAAQHVTSLVADLPERERTVIRRHFGLDGHDPQSLRQIADQLHVSVGTVHSIERTALALLRAWF